MKSVKRNATEKLDSNEAELAAQTKAFAKMIGDNPMEKLGKQLTASGIFEQLKKQEEAFARIVKPLCEQGKAFDRLSAIGIPNVKVPTLPNITDLIPEARRDFAPVNIKLPPNPVHKTNQHLAALTNRVEELVGVQAQQAELIDALLKAQIEGAKNQDRMARKQYVAAVTGLLIAAITILASTLL